MTLPPGQFAVDGFPRFGTHLGRPAPAVPADPEIAIGGAAVERPTAVALAELQALPRRELVADLHCVSGWSATGLRWEGVPFEALYRAVVEPSLRAGAAVTHVVFRGLDGYRSTVWLADALREDVLLADRLDGSVLDADHGAPLRLVSPSQYGFMSTKHLCAIDLLTREPDPGHGAPFGLMEALLRSPLVRPHQRARVWQEERHRHLPAWVLRPVYRLLIPPIRHLSARR